ncbi:MAG: NUDIX domain-containing protein [Candidatus Woesearchaeota archaeon]
MDKIGVGVGIMILRGGKVLLGRRHDNPKKAQSALHGEGTWTMPGGKLDTGETILEGATRETREETGIEIVKSKIISVQETILQDVHFITFGIHCTLHTGEPKVMEPDQITQWNWFPLDELPSPMYPLSKKIIELYEAKRFI